MLVHLLLVQSHVFRTERNVTVNRLFKELVFRVLEHQTDTEPDGAQRLLGAVDVLFPEQHAPRGGLQKPVEMLDKRALAAAGMTEQRRILTGGRDQYCRERPFQTESRRCIRTGETPDGYRA